MFLDEPEEYRFADFDIALNDIDQWSYPSWLSHLDHILITNELFDDLENDGSTVETIRIDDYLPGGWSQYESNISDHRPVAMKLEMNEVVVEVDEPTYTSQVLVYPNPAGAYIEVSFPQTKEALKLTLSNTQGQTIRSFELAAGSQAWTINTDPFSTGVYFLSLHSARQIVGQTRVNIVR